MKRMKVQPLLIVLGIICLTGPTSGYRILCLAPLGPKSHLNFYSVVVQALAERHKVTFVTPYNTTNSHPNILRIGVNNMDLALFMPNVFKHGHILSFLHVMGQRVSTLCSDALQQEQIQALKKGKFDVVLMAPLYVDCFLAIPYKLKVPIVWLDPASLFSPFAEISGNPWFPSFAPDPFFVHDLPLTFFDRVQSLAVSTGFSLYLNKFIPGWMEAECRRRKLCPEDMPSLSDLRNTGSLTLVNSIKTMERPIRPYMANVIHVGGIHCKFPEPLPEELSEWITESSYDGFIYFSLGSAVKTEDIPKPYLQTILKVFSSLRQRVIWKWDEDDLPNRPSNVRIGQWFPQQDILGNPHLKLFITHGGIQSLMESMFHGVPILGIPVFGDQLANLNLVERQGWGKFIQLDDLSEDEFRSLITECLNSHSMKTTAKKYSQLMRDQHYAPEEEATFWIEYVIRHQGAPHLRSPVLDMSWIELYNFDVWVIVLLVLFLVSAALILTAKKILTVFLSFTLKEKKE